MKFNFRKIASVLASAVLIGSTIGIAAAANYPAPFVAGGNADVAVVYGSSAASSDFIAAANIASNLQYQLAKQTATTGSTGTGSVSGESTPLFTGSTKIYVNSTINSVKSVATKTELPTILADGSFSGNVDASYTQTITYGSNPRVEYGRQPTSSDEPHYGLTLTTGNSNYMYNASVTFNKAVNFTNADSKNQQLTLFGQQFTVGSATTNANLVLLKSATPLNFDSSGTTSQEVTIDGAKYTVELVSASTTTATIKVTDAAGVSEQKEITEGYSKKVNGVTVAVNTADSNNLKYTASIVAGSDKVTLTSGSAVTVGDSDTVIDGTKVTFDNVNLNQGITKMTVQVSAPSSDADSIDPGKAFVDPVFGTFKVDFPGLSIPDDSTTARENIKVASIGDTALGVTFTDVSGNTKTVQYAYNDSSTGAVGLQWDSSGHNIVVQEGVYVNKSDYVVVGNEADGHLVKVSTITNQTTSYNNDAVKLTDVFTGDTYTATLTAEGSGTITIGGKVYGVSYYGDNSISDDARQIVLNYPDSTTNDKVILPTISTSKGAKVMFYKPITINMNNLSNSWNVDVPNGANAYQAIPIAVATDGNYTVNSIYANASSGNSTYVGITNTGLTLRFKVTGANETTIYLQDPVTNTSIVNPSLVVLEEKDNNNQYQDLIVTTKLGNTATTAMSVSDVSRSWLASTGSGLSNFRDTSYATSTLTKEADLWGSIVTIDSGDSVHKSATISYPDEQVYAQLYVGAASSTVTAGTASGGNVAELGSVNVKDTDIASVSGQNLIVIGGSCINSVAQKILGASAPLCGADFTTKTGIAANQALIQVVANPYLAADTTKVAMLIAGYEADDTTKAAKYVTTALPSTAVGTTKLSTSTTVATVVTA